MNSLGVLSAGPNKKIEVAGISRVAVERQGVAAYDDVLNSVRVERLDKPSQVFRKQGHSDRGFRRPTLPANHVAAEESGSDSIPDPLLQRPSGSRNVEQCAA